MTTPSLYPAAQRPRAFLPKTNVLDIAVDAIDMTLALQEIQHYLETGEKGYVCVADVHGVMEAQRDPALRAVYAGAAMTVPDGMPLVWVGQLQGCAAMRHVTGPDLMIEVFSQPQFARATHFFYGGEPGVAEELRHRLKQRFPSARIVGTYTPPFRDLTAEEEADFIATIQELKPEILWVGIGCPRQELFMGRYLPLLQTNLIFGVGAAFDYHTGRVRDCAPWIKRAGLQWLHRLLQDPKRLWWRYLRNNPAFLWKITLQLLSSGGRRNTSHGLPPIADAAPRHAAEAQQHHPDIRMTTP